MWRLAALYVLLNIVLGDDKITKVVELDYGIVSGEKYWDGDFYTFYGIPYASIPTGRDRFKGPLPPKPWEGILEANRRSTICHQCYFSGGSEEVLLDGDDDCLLINILSPLVASENNLLPVLVYIHSGAFSGGSGNMAFFYHLARHDVITVSFNYRLGAFGFACLGNEEIPGNAGLKDQVAALRWIQDNIKKFGGDPKRVTLAGFSVGAAMAELLSFSKSTIGLFDKLILESGSAFSPFAINRNPVETALNLAYAMGYNGTNKIEELTEFYLNAENKQLAEKSINYYLKNSTFGFSPCIENLHEGMEAILLESPIDVINKGEQNDVALLTGFANMEGISRTIKFGTWREEMNENLADFLPADLKFDSEKARNDTITKLHADISKRPVYLYEFSYVGKLNIEHNYMDRIKGASHRDQTAYLLDFFGYTNNYKDLDVREKMTLMWTDFVKYENPTPYESFLITVKWLPYTKEERNYIEINKKMATKKDLFENSFEFWNKIYEKFYWNPIAPKFIKTEKKDGIKTNHNGKIKDGSDTNSKMLNDNKIKQSEDTRSVSDSNTVSKSKPEKAVKSESALKTDKDMKHQNAINSEKNPKNIDIKLEKDPEKNKPESVTESKTNAKPESDGKTNKESHSESLRNSNVDKKSGA
ncbi:carboxyl/choline esterase CCE001g [Danaus plexippus plexippus]|uniref:Carboxyl/choline esterase CCE001g n=1 Tax=Danaus plexippus plexippus TaxID=278856 RepID=A0A212FG22_DANPL|nr:carboxyl/choline esterase CCE001g [Danaus plexippus plexippus]